MPEGMARAIEDGSKLSQLDGSSYQWKFVFGGQVGGGSGVNQTVDVLISGTDGEFSRNGRFLTFETNEDIQVTNPPFSPGADFQVNEFTVYIRQGGTDYVVVPTISLSVLLEPQQILVITEITLEVND